MMPQTFEQYQVDFIVVTAIGTHEQASLFLRQILRQFEHVLLQEVGYAIDFSTDASQKTFRSTSIINFNSMMAFASFASLAFNT